MKYTIELTSEERNVLCGVIRAIRDNSIGEHRLFEDTILFKFDENSTDYDAAYRKGIEDGNKIADKDLKEVQDSTYDVAYNKGLEDGYEGCKYLHHWFATTCFYEDEDILFPEYKRREVDTCCLEDIITDVGFAEVLKRVKVYEERKKAEDTIECGDEVTILKSGVTGIVFAIKGDEVGYRYEILSSDAKWNKFYEHQIKKTGRNLKVEVEQLLDKLKGEK